MPSSRKALLALSTCALLTMAASAPARAADVDLDAKARSVAKSLVIVDFTLKNENSSGEDSGQGILLNKDGVILIAGTLINEIYPKEWISEIKVRLPGKNFAPVTATMLGRTRDRLFAFLKTSEPVDAPPFEPGEAVPIKLGQEVFGVAILGKSGGYQTYVARSEVRAIIDLTHTIGSTASFGLTRGNSPVYDTATGSFAGLTIPSMGESMILRDGGSTRRIDLTDEDQSSAFLPMNEIQYVFKDIPDKPFDLRRPWLALDNIEGLKEDVRSAKKIEQTSGVIIGSVIPDDVADKAGLKAGDIVLTVDGKEFSTNPVPDMMVMHFSRLLDERKPGDKITLGILRAGKKMDIPVTLGTAPRLASEMPHVFSEKIGVVTRDLVFNDAYSRHLPQDTKGVMVALVKDGSPAFVSSTPLRAGMLITKVNDQPIDDQKQFLDVVKRELDKPDLKEMVFVIIQRTGETQVCRVDMTK